MIFWRLISEYLSIDFSTHTRTPPQGWPKPPFETAVGKYGYGSKNQFKDILKSTFKISSGTPVDLVPIWKIDKFFGQENGLIDTCPLFLFFSPKSMDHFIRSFIGVKSMNVRYSQEYFYLFYHMYVNNFHFFRKDIQNIKRKEEIWQVWWYVHRSDLIMNVLIIIVLFFLRISKSAVRFVRKDLRQTKLWWII
jgi:hypothetical protein